MSNFSRFFRRAFGLPEINLGDIAKNPLVAAYVGPLIDGVTKEAAARATDALPTKELKVLTEAGIAELAQRGIRL